jgi:hypothetical protein
MRARPSSTPRASARREESRGSPAERERRFTGDFRRDTLEGRSAGWPSASAIFSPRGPLVPDWSRVPALPSLAARGPLRGRKQRIAEDFYDIGLSLEELLKKKLYLPLGYKSFADMLRGRAVMSAAQANKLIQLVSTVPREEALAYGQEKAIALVEYARATPELDTPQTLFEKGTLSDGKAIAGASVRELKEGAKRVRKAEGKSKPKSAAARAAEDEAKAMRAWLRGRGARTASVEPIQRDGAAWIRIELPASAAAKLRA